MSADKNQIAEKSKELERLGKKADHLSDFGTLTSLISTAFYFFEKSVNKKLPKWLNNVSLASVGIGIAAVFASFYYRIKAGKIALHSPEHIENVMIEKESTTTDAPKSVNDAPEKKPEWVHKTNETQANPSVNFKH